MNNNETIIGILLLLPPSVDIQMREFSKQLNQGNEDPEIQLADKPRAHITLVHAYVDGNDITDIQEYLSKNSNAIEPLSLICSEFKEKVEEGVKDTAMVVNKTTPLQLLHEDVTKKLLSLNMKLTKHQDKFSFANFFPHITLAVDSHNQISIEKPINFVADTIALGRMGHYGTCQEIIKSWKLNN